MYMNTCMYIYMYIYICIYIYMYVYMHLLPTLCVPCKCRYPIGIRLLCYSSDVVKCKRKRDVPLD